MDVRESGRRIGRAGRAAGEERAIRNKVIASFAQAVADIPDGAVIGFAGFGPPGLPANLILELAEQGARELTLVANTTGAATGSASLDDPGIGMLTARGQVKKAICAFTAATHASMVLPFTRHYEAGEVEAELVPQAPSPSGCARRARGSRPSTPRPGSAPSWRRAARPA